MRDVNREVVEDWRYAPTAHGLAEEEKERRQRLASRVCYKSHLAFLHAA